MSDADINRLLSSPMPALKHLQLDTSSEAVLFFLARRLDAPQLHTLDLALQRGATTAHLALLQASETLPAGLSLGRLEHRHPSAPKPPSSQSPERVGPMLWAWWLTHSASLR